MSARPSRSMLEELRPPGGWWPPATPPGPPAGPPADEPATTKATPSLATSPPPAAVTRPARRSGEKRLRQQDAAAGWMARAACRGLDPALFFPMQGEMTWEAKEVCAGCPVRMECLEHALEAGERFGIWGGKSGRQLRQLRRARQAGRAA